MQIQIVSGIVSDGKADYRAAYPINMQAIPKQTGVSNGYLRTVYGISKFSNSLVTGTDRGGFNWNNTLYRVIGSSVVKVSESGTQSVLGNVLDDKSPCSMTNSFDRLGIQSGGNLYYVKDNTVVTVTDPDLGKCIDVIWLDGYFVSTDGTSIVVSDLNDPMSFNPLKYGSSEADPDPITGLAKMRNELYALNRYTIEVFDNVGGSGFPFQRIEGAIISKGVIGKDCKCVMGSSMAFLGSARNEAPSIYITQGNGHAENISTREIDEVIRKYSENQLKTVNMEYYKDRQNQLIYIHFPNEVWVYDIAASQIIGEPAWYKLESVGNTVYRAQNFTFCYDKFICGDKIDGRIGYIDESTPTQYGDSVEWQFITPLIYNEGKGVQIHQLELVGLTGRSSDPNGKPKITNCYSDDGGLTWSDRKFASIGIQGAYKQRVIWRPRNFFRNNRTFKFIGLTESHVSFARLEAQGEPLQW